MSLTEKKIKTARAGTATSRLPDGLGLILEVRPSGAKVFVKSYRFNGQQRRETIGTFPDTTLADARARTLEINKMVKAQSGPRGEAAPATPEATSVGGVPEKYLFEAACERVIAMQVEAGIAPATENKLRVHLGDAAQRFQGRDIREIESPEVLEYIREIQKSGRYETASRVRRRMSQVFQIAAAHGLCRNDPANVIRAALPSKPPGEHPGLTSQGDVGLLMRQVRQYDGDAPTKAALLLTAYTALRSLELRGAKWGEIDFETATWMVPKNRMKKRYGDHLVPLSRQAIETLRWLEQDTGGAPDRLVFRSRIYRDCQ